MIRQLTTALFLGTAVAWSVNGMAQEPPPTKTLADFLGVPAEALAPGESGRPTLLFQTNVSYDPRIDLRTDRVIVHRHGSTPEEVADAIKTWGAHSPEVIRMFFASSDAGEHFEQGRITGKPEPGAPETLANGDVLRCGTRAYMFPTDVWTHYLYGFIDHALDNGAAGVSPEEPFGHAAAGYEEAYKARWADKMDRPWEDPHSTPEAFWRSCRFKSDQFFNLVDNLSTHTKREATRRDVEATYILPIHSILSNMSGGRIFPNVRSIGLENVDGWIGQVWQGPVNWAIGGMAGKRYDGFFESALALYSTFAELSRDTNKNMYFLIDPVEDDPQFSWRHYKRNYEMSIVAMMHFPWVDSYEVMPWPDRIFLPGFTMGSGTPGPADYLTELMAMQTVLGDMEGASSEGSTNDLGLGLLLADTASWEIQGPKSKGFEPFHGLYLPFASQGVFCRTPWLERAVTPGYLAPFKTLLLSYDNQKPDSPAIHDGLIQWVKDGGSLVVVGGVSAYDQVDGWWNERGFATPTEALLVTAGVAMKAGMADDVKEIRLEGGASLAAGIPVSTFIPAVGAAVYARMPNNAPIAFRVPLGEGAIIVTGTPASWAAQKQEGVEFIQELVRWTASQAGGSLDASGAYTVKRGPYTAAYILEGERTFPGVFVNLFDPIYPVVTDPVFKAGESVLLKDIGAAPEEGLPGLLFASYKLTYSRVVRDEMSFVLEGPAETLAAVRVTSPAGRARIASAEAMDADGKTAPVLHRYDPDTKSSLVQVPYHPDGVAVRLRWSD